MTVRGDFNELRSLDINTTNDGVKANISTVPEDVFGHAASSHLHTALTVCVEPVKFKFARNHPGYVVTVSGCASSSAENVGRKLMELLTVLVSDYGASCGSRVSGHGDSTVEYDTTDGRSRLGIARLVRGIGIGF